MHMQSHWEAALTDYSHFSKQPSWARTMTHFGFMQSLYDSRLSSCIFKSWNVKRTRHWSRRRGKFLHWSPLPHPTAATCHVCKKCHQTWAKKKFQMVELLEEDLNYLLWTHHVWKHLSDKWYSSAPHVFKQKFEKYSTTILPRSDKDILLPHSILTCSFVLFVFVFFDLMEQFVESCCVSLLSALHGFTVKSFWFAVPSEFGLTLSFLSTLWLKGSPCW